MIPLVIKADTSGSLEALEKEVMKLSNENAGLNILRLKAGNVTEDDVKLASSGQNAIIIGFRVRAGAETVQLSERLGVNLAFFDIIYKVNEWLEDEIKKRIPQAAVEKILGTAEIIRVFSQEKNRQIIGGRVMKGMIINGKYAKISRRGMPLAKGKILELQHNKIKVPEVEEDKEFGALVDVKNTLAKGDIMEIYDFKTDGEN